MSILNTYDDFNFMIILLFLYVFLFLFMVIIINNIKSRKQLNKNMYSSINNTPNSTLQCIPRPTLINNTIQMTCQ